MTEAEKLRRNIRLRAILILVGIALIVAAAVAYWFVQILRGVMS